MPVARLGWLAPARQLLPVAMVLLGLLLHCSQGTGICSRCEYQVLIGKYNTIPCGFECFIVALIAVPGLACADWAASHRDYVLHAGGPHEVRSRLVLWAF